MIKKLKIKFIVLGTSVLFALLAAIVFAMNLVNYRSMINEADGIISLISENNGAFPDIFQPSNMAVSYTHLDVYKRQYLFIYLPLLCSIIFSIEP